MSDTVNIFLDAALGYAGMDIAVFPCEPGRKKPACANGFHDATTDKATIRAWWTQNPRANVAMATGKASGLFVVDVDPCHGGDESLTDLEAKHGPLPETAEVLTGGGGRHIFIAHPGGHVPCSQGEVAPGIDIKGDGGYVVLPPSIHPNGKAYTWEISSDIADVRPAACPEWLLALIRAPGEKTPHGRTSRPTDANLIPSGQRNSTLASLAGGMRRMGMSQDEIHAALQATNLARCNPPLADREVEAIAASVARYEPDSVSVALVENHYDQMFGPDGGTDVDISAIVQACGTEPPEDPDDGPPIQRLHELMDSFTGLNRPVVHGLLREGETMNIIASPKMGKSWLASSLGISVASGLDWLGLAVEQGRVLHIDNELHACNITYRYGVVSKAMGMPHHLYSRNIDLISLRGKLRDLYSMGSMFRRVDAGQYKIVIVDAFYRTLPLGTDENDNGAMANLYNQIDHYAAQMQCAFVLIHHASKGNQASKAVTDVGAGAGSQSRAADTHLILRPHQAEGIVVLESAVRSWPPMGPQALVWNWPLFTPVDEVDTSALLGAAKPKARRRDVALEDFVAQSVAVNDPSSKNSVRYEAGQRFGLSERKADEMLELAIERGLVAKIRVGAYMRYVKNRPGMNGDKALWTAALLDHDPEVSVQEVAQQVGISERYVRQIRNAMAGTDTEFVNTNKCVTAELDAELAKPSSGASSGRESYN